MIDEILPQEHFGKSRLSGHWYIGPVVKIHSKSDFSSLLQMHHVFLLIRHTVQREFLRASQLLFPTKHMETFPFPKWAAWYRGRIIWGRVKSRRELRFFHSRELSPSLNFYFSYINWDKRWVELAVVEGLCHLGLYQSLTNAALLPLQLSLGRGVRVLAAQYPAALTRKQF